MILRIEEVEFIVCKNAFQGEIIKKIIVTIFMLGGFFFTLGYGQKNNADIESPEVKIKLEKLIFECEERRNNPEYLRDSVMRLRDQLNLYHNEKKHINAETKEDITEKLVEIYYSLCDENACDACKNIIINVIGQDRGEKAQEFFFDVLFLGTKEQAEQVLKSIRANVDSRSDKFRERFRGFILRGYIEKNEGLAILKTVNPQAELKETPEVRARIEDLISRGEKGINNPLILHDAMHELDYQLNKYRNSDVFVSSHTQRDITKRLIKIYYSIEDEDMYHACKILILEAITGIHLIEAKGFLLHVLEYGTERQRDQALSTINFGQFRDDEIYDKIKNLLDRQILKISAGNGVFSALKGANPSRALKEITNFLKKTKDVGDFTSYGLLLCDYKNPNLLDVLIDRYEKFKEAAPKNEEEYKTFAPARTAFDRELLRKYIKIREGERLKTAIEILKGKGISGDNDLPLWREKLKSKNITTREAVMDFLDFQIKDRGVSENKVKDILEEAEKSEENEKLKNKIRGILKNLKTRGR